MLISSATIHAAGRSWRGAIDATDHTLGNRRVCRQRRELSFAGRWRAAVLVERRGSSWKRLSKSKPASNRNRSPFCECLASLRSTR